jgi:hypothetical protein
MANDWSVETLDDLRMLVADKLSVKIELLSANEDVDQIAEKYPHVTPYFRRLLHAEFLKGDTEGLLIDNPKPGKGGRDYLVIVDARDQRRSRANFTSWHELAHLLLYPRRQLVLEGFRRSPTPDAKLKDPVESAADQIAGLLAFWEPIFKPALQQAADGDLSLDSIERACAAVAPGASLQSACLAAVRVWDGPVAFLTAATSCKSDGTAPALRVQTIIANDEARAVGCAVRKHMRVPESSALCRAHNTAGPYNQTATENQSAWEVSGHGPLPPLIWRVEALNLGRITYGLLTHMTLVTASAERH